MVDPFYSSIAIKNNIDNSTQEQSILNNIQRVFNEILILLDEKFKNDYYITSFYRCERLNLIVNGEEDSKHLLGLAVDISWFTSKKLQQILDFLVEKNFTIKLYTNHIHIELDENINST